MAKKKEAEKKPTAEEIHKMNLDRKLNSFLQRKSRYKKATRTFDVGERVIPISAFWQNCIVLESVEGLFYRISYETTSSSRGETKVSKDETWVEWMDISKNEEKSLVLFNERAKNINNQFSFSNRELEDLISKRYHFGVNDTPDYQRDLVWSLEDKELLIDSIFKGIEIGKFVFITLDYKDENSPLYEILDGKQRMNAICDFIEDRFPYKGVYYSQLQTEDRRYFNRYLITIGESRGELSDSEKYEYFLRLNTRGREQSKEHLEYVKELMKK